MFLNIETYAKFHALCLKANKTTEQVLLFTAIIVKTDFAKSELGYAE